MEGLGSQSFLKLGHSGNKGPAMPDSGIRSLEISDAQALMSSLLPSGFRG